MSTVAYVVTYYGQKAGFLNHVRMLASSPPSVLKSIELVVVNDGHGDPPPPLSPKDVRGFHSVRCVNLDTDIGYNNGGARNVGIDATVSPVVFVTDLDECVGPERSAAWLETCRGLTEGRRARFGRTEQATKKGRLHPNVFACRRDDLDRYGWFHEAFNGKYGYEDTEFLKRWTHRGAVDIEAFVLAEPADTNYSDALGPRQHRATVVCRDNRMLLDRLRARGYAIPTERCGNPGAHCQWGTDILWSPFLSGPEVAMRSVVAWRGPVALARVGDMELQLASAATSDDTVNRIMRHHFGYRLRGKAGIEARRRLRRETRAYMSGATHLSRPCTETGDAGYDRIVRKAGVAVAVGADAETMSVEMCDSFFFQTLLKRLAPRHLSVIGCRDLDWAALLPSQESAPTLYTVPEQGSGGGRAARFYPEGHDALAEALHIREDGEVFIVAAGILSGMYIRRLQELSAESGRNMVALDVGSAMDRWAGIWSRTHMDRETWLSGTWRPVTGTDYPPASAEAPRSES